LLRSTSEISKAPTYYRAFLLCTAFPQLGFARPSDLEIASRESGTGDGDNLNGSGRGSRSRWLVLSVSLTKRFSCFQFPYPRRPKSGFVR
jgi:hypothetical protein